MTFWLVCLGIAVQIFTLGRGPTKLPSTLKNQEPGVVDHS